MHWESDALWCHSQRGAMQSGRVCYLPMCVLTGSFMTRQIRGAACFITYALNGYDDTPKHLGEAQRQCWEKMNCYEDRPCVCVCVFEELIAAPWARRW